MPTIKSLRRLEETTIRVADSVGDNWHMSWANDDRQYTSLCDGSGFPGLPRADYNSRCFAIAGAPGTSTPLKFEFLPGYPDLINNWQVPEAASRYYNFGILALDGAIYQYLSTPNRSFKLAEPRFYGAKLIYSPDNGKTWHNQDGSTPVVWEKWEARNRSNMCFLGEEGDAFSLITVLQMGKNYGENKDGYVYLYAPNGNTDGTMNQMVLCRVAKKKILSRGDYEFFSGGRSGGGSWSRKIEDRAVVHTFPAGWVNRHIHPYAWHPNLVYYPATGQYLMANWGMGTDSTGDWFTKPSYLGFWTASNPWGPWTQVHEETAWTPANDPGARAYQPQVAPKWISPDGKSFWLVWTDFQLINEKRPYYAFNVQKLDVTLG